VDTLVSAGFYRKQNRIALTALVDVCRTSDIAPTSLTLGHAESWLSVASAADRKKLRNGLKALDVLRDIERLRPFLPSDPVTPAKKSAGRFCTLPAPLQHAVNDWVDVAAREQVEDQRYAHLAGTLSAPTRAKYSAATSLYVQTLLQQKPDLATETDLSRLVSESHVEMVFAEWAKHDTYAARTLSGYATDFGTLLQRNGHTDVGAYAIGLTKILPRLIEGRSAAKTMSPRVKKWCQTLLRDPKKTSLFQIQHLEYYRRALEALAAAKQLDLELKTLSKPDVLAALPDKERSTVKVLLRQVRMFGMMAAYAAIALEGAPFRRQNMLSLRHTGPNKTMHLHLSGRSPHVIIKFPNEELKNGKYLSERGEELEPITIEKRGPGDHAVEIIKFYLKEIRPQFPEADKTHAFFPPLEAAKTADDGFVTGTFYIWLAEASAAIGLPMNSHNYRHGYCSIDINEGRRSMEDLAKILGDTVAVVQRNYAWINAKQSVLNVQQDTARRRAEILRGRGVSV
jgi:integrase